MTRRYQRYLIPILVLIAFAIWVNLPNNPGIHLPFLNREIGTKLGLDLVGGVQALLEADLPPEDIDPGAMSAARTIIEQRVNGLGVTETVVQQAGDNRIVVEIPDISDPAMALELIQETGLLEFVDMGSTPLPPGTIIKTDYGSSPDKGSEIETETSYENQIWHTVMTGKELTTVQVTADQLGKIGVGFALTDEGKEVFASYTSTHVGQFLAIVLDKEIISVPQVETPITQGTGIISGNFTQETANHLAIQLRYGALPIPLKVVESKTVGPTLGQDSLRKSMIAGGIGLGVVILFMALYYRLPGVLADLALIVYSLITFALFRLIPVTLTLPGIAGFVLSMGVAVDANVLIFERLKEELRAGRLLIQAIDLGWKRAWPSIRDSNLSTLITCGILFWFGNTFGASIVKGFALTLALGVLVSLFTAITVTRTFLHVVLDNIQFAEHPKWFGV
ncbi:MAG: protein translocase subunit SecD [Chloroflexota bacterium]